MSTYTETQIRNIGGNVWERGGCRRVYLNNWSTLAGLRVERYNSGNISYAELNGEEISNAKAFKLLSDAKVFWEDGQIFTNLKHGARHARIDADDLIEGLLAGIAKAVANTDLTARQAAEKLGISVRTVQRHAKQGKLTARKDTRGRWIITL
jgi:excisionase family DNA binding protein